MMDATTEVCREIMVAAVARMQEHADPIDVAHACLMTGFVLVRRDCDPALEREELEAMAEAIDRRLAVLRAEAH